MDNAKDNQSVEEKEAIAEQVASAFGDDVVEFASEAAETESAAEPTLEQQLAAAKAEAAENYGSYLRAVAYLDTYRRRVMREKDELKQYAKSGVLEAFLPVYDNLALGLMSAESSADPKVIVQGIQMVLAQFKNLLEENGIKEICPGKGDDFNPNQEEAFQTQPSAEVAEGKVLAVMRKGFSLNGRLIRPASVVVSGGPAV